MSDSDRVSFRLGDLSEPLAAWCESTGQTKSEAARQALASMLGVDAPVMQSGNPDASRETALAANKARWKPRKKRRKE